MKILLNILIGVVLSLNVLAQQVQLKVHVDAAHPFIILDDTLKYYGNNLDIHLTEGKHNLSIYQNQFKWSGGFIADTINIESGVIRSARLGTIKEKSSISELFYKYELSEERNLSEPRENILSAKNLLGNYPLVISAKKDTLKANTYSRIFPLEKKNIETISGIGRISFNGTGKEKYFGNSKWFPALIGTAIVFGGIAAYTKTVADKKYDDYLVTENPALLTETNRMDIISGVALGLMEINIGYIIYKLLSQ